MNAVRVRWQALARRERNLVAVGAAILLGTVVYLGVQEPLAARLERAQRSLLGAEETLAWLAALPAASGPAAADPLSDVQAMLGAVGDSARQFQLDGNLKRLAPGAEPRTVALSFDHAPYTALIQWLGATGDTHGAVASRARLEKTDTAGLVNAEVTLRFP